MTDPGNSCRTWNTILSKTIPKKCPRSCFEPRNAPCSDGKKLTLAAYGSHVVYQDPIATFAPDEPVRRKIDMKVLCPSCNDVPERLCNLGDAQNATHKNNFCSPECRPLSTYLHLKECTKRPRTKPAYKHCVQLKDQLFVGRAFPVKLRIRRQINHCLDCSKELYFRDPVADNSSVVVLTNCCDVKVYDDKYIENWHRVPILSIAGKEVMKKRTIDEVCKLEVKKVPIKVEEVKPVEAPPPKAKKGGKKGKGKK